MRLHLVSFSPLIRPLPPASRTITQSLVMNYIPQRVHIDYFLRDGGCPPIPTNYVVEFDISKPSCDTIFKDAVTFRVFFLLPIEST